MNTIFVIFLVLVCFHLCTSSDVQTAFTKYEIFPDILKVTPKKILQMTFPSGATAELGNELTPTQVKDKPQVTWDAIDGAYYTLIMVDPDMPSRLKLKPAGLERASVLKYREMRLWTVMNIPGNSVERGDETVEYLGSAPLIRTGLHRIITLVYKQPNGMIKHKEPHTGHRSIPNRLLTTPQRFAKKYNLGDPEFGNFFEVQHDEYSDKLLMELIGLQL